MNLSSQCSSRDDVSKNNSILTSTNRKRIMNQSWSVYAKNRAKNNGMELFDNMFT